MVTSTDAKKGVFRRRPGFAERCRVWRLLGQIRTRCDREAVLRCLPRSPHQFVPKILRLAAELKAVDPRMTAADHFTSVAVWREVAGDAARGWSEAATLREFARRFDAADAATHLERVASQAKSVLDLVTAMARTVGRVFFLSARFAERMTGVPKSTAHRRLAELEAAGSLRVRKRGVPSAVDRLATVYDASPLFALSDRGNDSPNTPLLASPTPARPATPPGKPDSDAEKDLLCPIQPFHQDSSHDQQACEAEGEGATGEEPETRPPVGKDS